MENLKTTPKSIVTLNNIATVVVEHENIDYIRLKSVTDSIGIEWRKARKTSLTQDNVSLFGTKELLTPALEVVFYENDRKNDGLSDPRVTKKEVYIRFDKVHGYLFKVSVGQIRANGNPLTADLLLEKQKEWASVLNRYEQGETVSKNQRSNDLKELKQLYDLQKATTDKSEKLTIGVLIKQKLTELAGKLEAYKDPQQELDV